MRKYTVSFDIEIPDKFNDYEKAVKTDKDAETFLKGLVEMGIGEIINGYQEDNYDDDNGESPDISRPQFDEIKIVRVFDEIE